jgi:hypothetical protein
MPTRRLLFLDATRLTAYRWQAGHLFHEGEFAPDPAGLEAFGEYVAGARNSHFHLLADLAEEGFQVEEVPFIRGGDRGALIRRKLAQHFYGTPYSVALSLGRAKQGRRDERLLLAALTRPTQIESWVATLRGAEGQLAGIFTPSLVASHLVSLLGAGTQTFLFVSVTRAGLRQTLFDNGQVIFSRLTALATGTTEEMAVTCATESEHMYQYMAGQRLVARGSKLPARVLVHPAQMGVFREICTDTAAIHFEFVDLLALCGKVKLHTPPKDTHAEALFLHLMSRRPPREQFAPAADCRHYRLGRIGSGLRAAGYTVFGACLLFAARHMLEYRTVTQGNAAIAAETLSDRQRYEGILQALPRIPLGNDALRALVGRHDKLLSNSAGPEPLYLLVSQALHESPRVELGRLAWALGSGKDAKAAVPVPAATTPAAAGVSPAPTFETIDVDASLPLGMASDHRAQIAAVEGFVERLRARKLQVQTLRMPFEAESTKSLKSGADTAAQPQAPQFSLRVTRRIS